MVRLLLKGKAVALETSIYVPRPINGLGIVVRRENTNVRHIPNPVSTCSESQEATSARGFDAKNICKNSYYGIKFGAVILASSAYDRYIVCTEHAENHMAVSLTRVEGRLRPPSNLTVLVGIDAPNRQKNRLYVRKILRLSALQRLPRVPALKTP